MDIGFRFKKAREELGKFQMKIREKMGRRVELEKEIQDLESKIQNFSLLEMELRKKRLLLLRNEMETKRLLSEKARLQREIPYLQSELRKLELERRFGKEKGKPIGKFSV